MTTVSELAERQLDAYNDADLDRFCACYHPDVRVLDEDGRVVAEGQRAFRARYVALFETTFGASVDHRIAVGPHCVDHEHWWRLADGVKQTGEVMVRYRARDGLIDEVQFFKPTAKA